MNESQRARHAATRHVLAAPGIASRTRRHVSGDSVDWAGVLADAESMSGGERLLVDVARDLWVGDGAVALRDVHRRLGPGSFDHVVEALRIARGERRPGDELRHAA